MYREEQTAKLVCTSLCTAHSSEESERKRLLGRLVSVCAENENEKSRRKKEKKRKNYCVSSALTVLGLCNSRSSAMIDGCDLVAPTAADLLHDQLTSTALYGRAERTGAAKHLTAATTHCTVCYGGVGHSWKIFYSMVRLPSGGEN